MKRLWAMFVFFAVGPALAVPGSAADLERRPLERTPVVVNRGWPLQRERHEVVVHPSREKVRVRVRVEPRVFIPPIIFPVGPIVPVPVPGRASNGDYRPYDESDRGRSYRRDERHDFGRRYQRDRLVWADSEIIYSSEDWAEFTLDCDTSGDRLWFEVSGGRARIDWAEVVFDTGETQVVDFSERSIGPGVYPLLDFRDGRRIDHVRMVAKAVSRQVKLILRMEK